MTSTAKESTSNLRSKRSSKRDQRKRPSERRRKDNKETKESKDPKLSRQIGNNNIPDNVRTWYDAALARGVTGCIEEFQQLKKYVPSDTACHFFELNTRRNRYKDVRCLDATRVVLNPAFDNNNYIHASWTSGAKGSRQFICTQGPLENTTPDFWHMVYQVKSGLVIMLCDIVEKGKQKCYPYWPREEQSDITSGAYRVRNRGIKHDKLGKEDAVITAIELTPIDGRGDRHQCIHVHWANWPDRGVPTDSKTLIILRRKVSQENPPVIVHCSAGIGRTGTLVAADHCLGAIERSPPECLDIPTVVKSLRDQRLHSVQNEHQYVYLYRCVIDYITIRYKLSHQNSDLVRFWTAHQALQVLAK